MSHTPGPWEIQWGPDAEDKLVCWGIRVGRTGLVATDAGYYALSDEDAHLIAAAPDLLAALEAVERHGFWGVQDQVRAAIAKAHGRNSASPVSPPEALP